MEVYSVNSSASRMWSPSSSLMEAIMVETALSSTLKSLACVVFLAGTLLDDIYSSPVSTLLGERFPFDELYRKQQPDVENKDASDTEDDDDEDDDDNAEQDDDDDAGDEDFSAGEGDEEADPEDDPEANGEGASDNEDDDDDDDDDGDEDNEDEDGEDEEEEDDEEEDEEVPQPPTKKRK